MPELTEQNIGNLMMIGGGTIGMLWMFRGRIAELWNKYKPGPLTPEDPLSEMSVHDIVEVLIQDRVDAGDEEGVMLIGTFGKHIYDYQIKEADNEK